jgi:hypothetical protein
VRLFFAAASIGTANDVVELRAFFSLLTAGAAATAAAAAAGATEDVVPVRDFLALTKLDILIEFEWMWMMVDGVWGWWMPQISQVNRNKHPKE